MLEKEAEMPFKPAERLYRSFAASNFQPVEREDSTASQEPSYKVRGYYTVWNSEYELYPRTKYWPAEYEQVDSHALDDADLSDVIFQENHEGSPLARIRNGSLQLGTDEHGAWCIADLGGCQRGRDIFESIKNGLIVEMSFGFIIDDTDESNGYTTFQDENGDYHTTITRVRKVFDCSCVSIPASPYTEISELRSLSAARERIEADRKAAEHDPEPEQEEMRELTKPALTDEELDAIADALERRAKERKAEDAPDGEKEERELPDFLKDDDDEDDDEDEEKRESDEDVEERDCDDEEERRSADEARARRMRRARAMALINV